MKTDSYGKQLAYAEKKLSEHINEPLGFCPLLRDECRMDCVSYKKASVYKSGYSATFFKEHCLSPIITGIVEYYNYNSV
jgi:hypothetical protein